MSGLSIKKEGKLDFLALGALVHRLDPGIIPFRRAKTFDIHISGGEYNVAANLADCFGMKTGIASAMVDNGIGELVEATVRQRVCNHSTKRFKNDGVRGRTSRPFTAIAASAFVLRSCSTIAPTKPVRC